MRPQKQIILTPLQCGVIACLQKGMWLETRPSFSDRRVRLMKVETFQKKVVVNKKRGAPEVEVKTMERNAFACNIQERDFKILRRAGVIGRCYTPTGGYTNKFWLTKYGGSLQLIDNNAATKTEAHP